MSSVVWLPSDAPDKGATPSTTLWGSTEMGRPEGLNSKGRKAESGGVLWEGMFPFPPARGSGDRCKLPHRVRREAAVTWRVRTFYRLIKPLLVPILLISIFFTEIFAGVRATQDPITNFCGVRGPNHSVSAPMAPEMTLVGLSGVRCLSHQTQKPTNQSINQSISDASYGVIFTQIDLCLCPQSTQLSSTPLRR